MQSQPVIEQVDPLGPVALSLLRQAAIEARELYPELARPNGAWPTNAPTPERGVYLVAFAAGAAIACGALRPLDREIAEVRRMFVVRGSRRRGLARAVLGALEEHAGSFGFARLRLETGERQVAAIALYESCGFQRIAPFGDYASDPTSVCFEKPVAAPSSSPTLVDYDASYLEPLVRLWRESFEFGVGITDPHPLSEQREDFVSRVVPGNRVTLALLSSRLVGFVAATDESVAQLHVQVGLHRQGIGSALLALAKKRSSGSLWLYTFARNLRACRFYEKHGFVVVERGFEPHWQLEDVKYRWSAPGRP